MIRSGNFSQFAIEHGPFTVDLHIQFTVIYGDFPEGSYVAGYQRVNGVGQGVGCRKSPL